MSKSNQKKTLKFIGLVPPPVNGMSLATAFMLNRLEEVCTLRTTKICKTKDQSYFQFLVVKALIIIYACLLSLLESKEPDDFIYIVANSRHGLFYDILLALQAKVKKTRVMYHHHTYNYVSSFDWRMQIVVWLLDEKDIHIVLCDKMRDDFLARYSSKSRFITLGNSLIVADQFSSFYCSREQQRTYQGNEAIRIGHISNLSIDKGLDLVIQVFESLIEKKIRAKLVLAGPVASSKEADLLRSVMGKYPQLIDYRGPVYGEGKQNFYNEIDVLMFPTKYRNEAYPLVMLEALAKRVPVITMTRGCIGSVLPSDFLCDHTEDYIEKAVLLIKTWSLSESAYATAVELAQSCWKGCLEKDTQAFSGLLEIIR